MFLAVRVRVQFCFLQIFGFHISVMFFDIMVFHEIIKTARVMQFK